MLHLIANSTCFFLKKIAMEHLLKWIKMTILKEIIKPYDTNFDTSTKEEHW